MRLFLMGDVHLGARLLEWGQQDGRRRSEIERAWNEAVELVLTEDPPVDAVIVAGDLFDIPNPEPEVVSLVSAGMERWVAAGKTVVVQAGDHDRPLESEDALQNALPEGVHRLESGPVDVDGGKTGFRILALDPVEGVPASDAKTDRIHVVVGRGVVDGDRAPGGDELPVIDPAILEGMKVPLLVLGGEHNFRSETWGSIRLVVPGTPVGLRPGEWGDRFWTLVTLGSGEPVIDARPRSVEGVTRVEIHPQAEGISGEADLVANLGTQLRGTAYLQVVLSGDVDRPWDDGWIEDAFASNDAVVRVVNRTRVAGDDAGWAGGESISVRGIFQQRIRERWEAAPDPEKPVWEGAFAAVWAEFQEGGNGHED